MYHFRSFENASPLYPLYAVVGCPFPPFVFQCVSATTRLPPGRRRSLEPPPSAPDGPLLARCPATPLSDHRSNPASPLPHSLKGRQPVRSRRSSGHSPASLRSQEAVGGRVHGAAPHVPAQAASDTPLAGRRGTGLLRPGPLGIPRWGMRICPLTRHVTLLACRCPRVCP